MCIWWCYVPSLGKKKHRRTKCADRIRHRTNGQNTHGKWGEESTQEQHAGNGTGGALHAAKRERQDISMPAAIGKLICWYLCGGAAPRAEERQVLSRGRCAEGVGKTGGAWVWRGGGVAELCCTVCGCGDEPRRGSVAEHKMHAASQRGVAGTAPLRGGSPKGAASDPFPPPANGQG